jgi:hypothetical protein
MPIVQIGSNSEYVAIAFPPAYSVDRCAHAEMGISVNCFHGHIHPFISADDIVLFTKQLRMLYETPKGGAILTIGWAIHAQNYLGKRRAQASCRCSLVAVRLRKQINV